MARLLLALLGVIAGLGGALFGQIAPVLFRHAESIYRPALDATGAIAYALTHGLRAGNATGYTLGIAGAIGAYTAILIAIAHWLSRRAIPVCGRPIRVRAKSEVTIADRTLAGKFRCCRPALPPSLKRSCAI